MPALDNVPVDPCDAFGSDQFLNLLGDDLSDVDPATGQRNDLGLALDLAGGAFDLQFGALAKMGEESAAGASAQALVDNQVTAVGVTASLAASGQSSGIAGTIGDAAAGAVGGLIGGATVGEVAGAVAVGLLGGGALAIGAGVVAGVLAAYALGKLAQAAYQANTGADLPPGYFNPEQEASTPYPGSSAAEQAAAQACAARHDPIVIDLIGNGLKIENLSGVSPYFDFTGGGFAEATSWIGSGNGFLVIKSSDAALGVSIGNGYELLGTGSEGAYAILQSLAGDGVSDIDSANPLFSQLAIWQDANGDGIAQPDEISSLSAQGIASININPMAADTQVGYSVITGVSSVTMTNGAQYEAAEVDLGTNQTLSEYVGPYSLTSSIEALPDIKGYGTIPDLSIAMSQDSVLLTMVQNLVSNPPTTEAELDKAIETIMYQWAGVSSVDPEADSLIDGRQVDFLQQYIDDPQPFSTNPSIGPAPWFIGQAINLDGSWNKAFDEIEARFEVQLPSSGFSNDFQVVPYTDLLMPIYDYKTSLEDIQASAPSDSTEAVSYWVQALNILSQSLGDVQQYGELTGNMVPLLIQSYLPSYISYDVIAAVAQGALTYVDMSALNNLVYGTAGTDLFDVSQSNMTIEGFGGGDEIIVNPGVANLNINEVENNPSNSNVLFFAPGVSESNVVVSADSSGDIILTYDAQGDQVTLDSMLFGPTSGGEQGPLHTGLPYTPSTEFGVQDVAFSDGTTWTSSQVIAMLQDNGSPTNTTLYSGTDGATLDPAGYANLIIGHGGADTILFNDGYGDLTIDENNPTGAEQSILQLGSGITAGEIRSSGDASGDLILTLGTTGTQITLDGMNGSSSDGVADAVFADGTTLTAAQLLADAGIGAPTNTVLYANADTTTLDPDGYAHAVVGAQTGQDIVYNEGYGDLTIGQSNGSPVLAFRSSVSEANIVVSQDGQGDIILTDLATGATIDLDGMASSGVGIDDATFSDGTTWTSAQIMQMADTGNVYNQALYLEAGYNVFDPAGYAHYIQSGYGVYGGNTPYTVLYNLGYGNLTINDIGNYGGFGAFALNGILQLGAGISEADVSVSGAADGSVVLTIGETGSQITIDNQLNGQNSGYFAQDYGIAEITFVDGTTWSIPQIAAMAETGSPNNTTIYSSNEVGTIDPAGYAHLIDGTGSASTIIYNVGYGKLTINEGNWESPLTTLALGAGINEADISVTDLGIDSAYWWLNSSNIVLNIGTSGDQITINNFAQFGEIDFANGTTLVASAILALADIGSTTNTTLTGDSDNNLFDPNGYAHEIETEGEPSTVRYDLGYGHLIIDGLSSSPLATLVMGAGITESEITVYDFGTNSSGVQDVVLHVGTGSDWITISNFAGFGEIEFSDGSTWTAAQISSSDVGSPTNTTLQGGDSQQVLDPDGYAHEVDGIGNDTIVYNAGYGDLIINESAGANASDAVLQFGPSITANEISAVAEGSDIILSISGTSAQLTLSSMLNGDGFGISYATFSDGQTLSALQIQNLLDIGSGANRTLYAFVPSVTLNPAGFAHSIIESSTTDTILYNVGDGNLTIDGSSALSSDVLQFGSGISAGDITVIGWGYDGLLLNIGTTGAQIFLDGTQSDPVAGIAYATFADGSILTSDQMISATSLGKVEGVPLFGYTSSLLDGNETLDPAGIVHEVDGANKAGFTDTVLYNAGYGNLTIYNQIGTTALEYGAGISADEILASAVSNGPYSDAELILSIGTTGNTIDLVGGLNGSFSAFGEAIFADGTILSLTQLLAQADVGSPYNKTLAGGASDATLDLNGYASIVNGFGGPDTILYTLDDGSLVINEEPGFYSGAGASKATLAFGASILESDLRFSTDGWQGDVIVTVASTGAVITIAGMLTTSWGNAADANGVGEISFTDGTTLDVQQIADLANTGANTTYYDSLTSGVVFINNSNDIVQFGSNISEADVSFAVDGYYGYSGYPYVLDVGTSGGEIVLQSPINYIEFGDGSTLSYAQIQQEFETGSPETQTLISAGGNATLNPAGYAHVVDGPYSGSGDDTILYSSDDGSLLVSENGSATLRFGNGITPSDLSVFNDGDGDLVIDMGSTNSQITLVGMVSDPGLSGISLATFSDGETLTGEQLLYEADTGSPINTTLSFGPAGTTLDPAGFAHLIVGASSDNTILYDSGDGDLQIGMPIFYGSTGDTLQFGSGISASDIALSTDSDYDIILTISGSQITLSSGTYGSSYYDVSLLRFADGSTLTVDQLIQDVEASSPREGTIYIAGDGETIAPASGIHAIYSPGEDNTVFYNAGDGNLVIVDGGDDTLPSQDILSFDSGISADEINVQTDAAGDLLLDIGTTGAQITLVNMADSPVSDDNGNAIYYGIAAAEFADGTTLSAAQLFSLAAADSDVTTLTSGAGGSTLDTAGQFHSIYGTGADTILYNSGYGDIIVNEAAANGTEASILQFGSGLSASDVSAFTDGTGDLILGIGTAYNEITLVGMAAAPGVEGVGEAVFADGTSLNADQLLALSDMGSPLYGTLYGSALGTTLDPAEATDLVVGVGGPDEIVYDAGIGPFSIVESAPAGSTTQSILDFGPGIMASDLSVASDANGDIIVSTGTIGGSVTLVGMAASPSTAGIAYAEFSDGSTLSALQLQNLADVPVSTNQTLYGDTAPITIDPAGLAGTIVGVGGPDTILYNTGYGDLNVLEVAADGTTEAVLAFGAGITPDNIEVGLDANGDYLLDVGGGGTITLVGMGVDPSAQGIAYATFENGAVLTAAQMEALADIGAPDNQTLYAGSGVATLNPAGYAHSITGWAGPDTIDYDLGDGNLDVSLLAAPPGTGAPIVGSVQSVLQFGSGITAGEITASSDGSNIYLDIGTTGSQITLDEMAAFPEITRLERPGEGYYPAEGIAYATFSDGTSLSAEQIVAMANTGSQSNQTLYSDPYSSILDPAGYAHFVDLYAFGGAFDGDTILYKPGYGSVSVDGFGSRPYGSTLANTISFAGGITPNDLALSTSNDYDLTISVDGSTDQLVLYGAADEFLSGYGPSTSGEAVFSDGTTLALPELLEGLYTGSELNTTLISDSQGETLNPAGFAHTIFGAGGPDTIIYDQGDGNLLVNEEWDGYASTSAAVIQFGSGLSAADITATVGTYSGGYPDEDLILTVGSSGAQITLSYMFESTSEGIAAAVFADGTTLDAQQLLSLAQISKATAQNPNVVASPIGGTLDPAGYAHTIDGRGGADTIVYGQNYGDLYINENVTSGIEQSVLQFGTGYSLADISVQADQNGDPILDVSGTGAQITLPYMGLGFGYGVSLVTFVDGATLTAAQIMQLADTGSNINRTLYINQDPATLDPAGYAHNIETVDPNYAADDVIVYNQGYGSLDIQSDTRTDKNENTLSFGLGISESDLRVSQSGSDIILSLDTVGSTITLAGMASLPGEDGVGVVAFVDGTTLDVAQVFSMLGVEMGSGENSTLVGLSQGTTFDPAGYAHLIIGTSGSDTILYGLSDLNLTLQETASSGAQLSVLSFALDIDMEDVAIAGDYNGDVVVEVLSTGAQITLTGMLASTAAGVGSIEFGDGSSLTASQIMAVADTGSIYDTTLYGSRSIASTLDPAGYAHEIYGAGDGTILFNVGDGIVNVNNGAKTGSMQSVLQFGPGISLSDVMVSQGDDNGIVIAVGTASDAVYLNSMLLSGDYGYSYGVNDVAFADGTTLSALQLINMADTGSLTNTTLAGWQASNTLDPNGYAHTVTDSNGGVDTIVYNAGYGDLTVNEVNRAGPEQSILQFGAGISESDVSVTIDASGDILLGIAPSDALITLDSMAVSSSFGVQGVVFSDGTTWTETQLVAMQTTQFVQAAPEETVLSGGYGNTIFDPAGSAHAVEGGAGTNTILYDAGYGDLTINEVAAGTQQSILQFGSDISTSDIEVTADAAGDIILTVATLGTPIALLGMLTDSLAGVGSIVFANGTSLSAQQLVAMAETGTPTNSVLYGNAYGVELEPNGPVHLIDMGTMANSIDYEVGDGNLTIDGTYATGNGQAGDVLAFGTGISASELTASTPNDSDLILTIGSSGSQITLSNMLVAGQAVSATETLNYGVSEFTFSDGTTVSPSQMIALLDTGSHLNTTLYAGSGVNTLDPAGYAHVVDGDGGDDTIIYNAGYGNLLVSEQNSSGPEQSTLQIGSMISVSDVSIGGDVQGDVLLTDTLSGTQITLADMLDSGVGGISYGVGSVVFEDPETLTAAQLIAAAESGSPTNTTLFAGAGNTTFQTNGYAQTINGNGGADTILYTPNQGNLQINEFNPNEVEQSVLQFGSGVSAADLAISTDGYGDVIVRLGTSGSEIGLTDMLSGTEYGVGSFLFADGTTLSAQQIEVGLGTIQSSDATLYATLSSETLDTKGYADAIQGNGGGDTIIYDPGYGNLRITEQSYPDPEQSVLQFGTGISEADVAVSQDQAGDIVLGIGSPAAQITLVGMLESNLNGVAAVEFADGTTWTAQQVIAMTEVGSPTHTTLVGGPGNNLFNPNFYAHVIDGNGGADTILFNLGYGKVTVNEENQSGPEQSVLQFGTGISELNIVVSQDAFGDGILTVGTAGDEVVFTNMLNNGLDGISFGVGSATFTDGTTLSAQQIINLAETGSVANTVLRAGPDGDVIDPNGYATLVEGGAGTNTIIYNQGYGTLTINEQVAGGTEASILQLGTGISASGLSATTDASGDVILTVDGQGDQITLTSMASGVSFGVGEAVFADGTTLSAAHIDALAASSTSLASSFTGLPGTITTTDEATVMPFASLAVADLNAGSPTETITVSLSNATNGTFVDANIQTDGVVDESGVLTITGTAAEVSAILDALVFTPSAHQVVPGDTVATNLVVTDVNSVGMTASAAITVITTAVEDAPMITGAASGQITTDETSVVPFSNVVISDPDFGANDAVTITVTGANGLPTDANGTLSGVGLAEIGTGTYTLVAGAPPSLTAEMDDLVFTSAVHQVAPGGTVTTGFTITVTQNELITTNTTTSLIATAANDPAAITGTQAGQAVGDEASLDPFSGVTISDPDLGVTETATITLTSSIGVATDANGVLSGVGLTKIGTGTYSLAAASPAGLTAELEALRFSPAAHQVSPGQTVATGFTLMVIQDGVMTTDTTTSVMATAENDAPVIIGAVSGQAVTDEANLQPLSGILISDPDVGVTESATITLTGSNGLATDADGTLSGVGLTKIGAGVYVLAAAEPASLTAAIDALTFTPAAHQVAPGGTVATGIILSVTQNGLTTTNAVTSIIATAVNDAPVITGAVSGQTTTDEAGLDPLSSISVADPDMGVTETATITLTSSAGGTTDADGTLSGASLTKIGVGIYSLAAASPAELTAELEALSFTPTAHQVAPGGTVVTGIGLSVTQNGLTTTNTVTSVIATAVNDAPVISGAVSGQATTDEARLNPLAGVTLSDPDIGVTETATISLTGTSGMATDADGTLSGNGLTKIGVGLYTLAAATPAALTAELDALSFTPTAHQVAPGSTVTTAITLSVTQNGLTTRNTATSVIATATAATLVSNGTLYALEAGETLNTGGMVHFINGGSFADTIIFNKGFGALTIEDSNPSGTEQSILQLGTGMTESALTISSDSSGDIILKDGVAGDQITLAGMLNNLDDGVGSVAFADGTTWTASEIIELATLHSANTVPDYGLALGSGAKTISGAGNFVIGAGIAGGNVVFQSNNSNGNLTIALLGANGLPTGDSITITGYWWNNKGQANILFPNGSTISVGNAVVDTWIGMATQTTLVGSDFSPNLFHLGAGGDQVTLGASYDGGNGQNILEFGYGDGAVTVTPNEASATIAFAADILPGDAIFESNNSNGNLTIELLGSNGQPTGDSMTITDYWWNSSGTNLAVFTNGTTLTINHSLMDSWIGTATQTTLVGSDFSPNLFDLGPGGDQVTLGATYDGGNGQNTLLFGYGDGAVSVTPNQGGGTIEFGAGIVASDVIFESNDNNGNLMIELLNASGKPTGDSMTIAGYWYNGTNLNTAIFANGTTLAINHQLTNTWISSATQTTLVGSDFSPNVFDLGPGGDHVTLGASYDGGNGQNIVNFGTGDGVVTITGNNGTATVDLASGVGLTDVTLSTDSSGDVILALADGTDKLVFAGGMYSSAFQQLDVVNGTTLSHSQLLYTAETGTTGNDTLNVPSGAEVIDGRGGNDVINGGSGYDTYIYRQGYGNLTINNAAAGSTMASGELDFGPGITEPDLWFSRSGNNLDIDILGSNSQIVVDNWYGTKTGAQLAQIKAYDGLEIDAGLNQLVAAMAVFSAGNPAFNPETATMMPPDANLQAAIAAEWHH